MRVNKTTVVEIRDACARMVNHEPCTVGPFTVIDLLDDRADLLGLLRECEPCAKYSLMSAVGPMGRAQWGDLVVRLAAALEDE